MRKNYIDICKLLAWKISLSIIGDSMYLGHIIYAKKQ